MQIDTEKLKNQISSEIESLHNRINELEELYENISEIEKGAFGSNGHVESEYPALDTKEGKTIAWLRKHGPATKPEIVKGVMGISRGYKFNLEKDRFGPLLSQSEHIGRALSDSAEGLAMYEAI